MFRLLTELLLLHIAQLSAAQQLCMSMSMSTMFSRLFVALFLSATLTAFISAGFQDLNGVATDRIGNTYVQDSQRILKYSAAGQLTAAFKLSSDSFGIAVTSSGQTIAYIQDTTSYYHIIVLLDAQGAVKQTIDVFALGANVSSSLRVQSISYDIADRLYAVGYDFGASPTDVLIALDVDNTLRYVVAGAVPKVADGWPYSVVNDQYGNVFVLQSYNSGQANRIVRFDQSSGRQLHNSNLTMKFPMTMTVDAQHRLYVFDAHTSSIDRLSYNCSLQHSWRVNETLVPLNLHAYNYVTAQILLGTVQPESMVLIFDTDGVSAGSLTIPDETAVATSL